MYEQPTNDEFDKYLNNSSKYLHQLKYGKYQIAFLVKYCIYSFYRQHNITASHCKIHIWACEEKRRKKQLFQSYVALNSFLCSLFIL